MFTRVKDLETKLGELKEESESRVDLLNELVSEVGWDDPPRAAALSEEAFAISQKLGYTKGIGRGIFNRAIHAYYVGDFKQAIEYGDEALEIFNRIGDRQGQGDAISGYGFTSWGLGDYDKALHHVQKALQIFQEIDDKERQAWNLTSIGGIYENVGDYANSERYHRASLEIFKETRHQVGEGRALSGLGLVLHRQGDHERALECHTRALELHRESGSRTSESRALNDIGLIYQSQDHHEKALEYHTQALEIRQELGNKRAETTSLLNLGRVHNQMGLPEKALDHLKRALTLAQETGEKPKVYQAHEALSRSYELLGDTGRALEHHKAFHDTKEEVFNSESNTKLKNLEIRFEVERVEKETEIHRLKNIDLADALEQLKATQAQLVQSEKMAALGKLISGVAHEVNTPTGVINSSTDVSQRAVGKMMFELNRSESIDEARQNMQRYLSILRDNNQIASDASRRITKIVENLKKFARLDEAERQTDVDVRDGIESTLALISPQVEERIHIVKELDEVPKIECYPNELNQLFMTLLLNATEAIEDQGTIRIATSSDNGNVHIEIADTGRGISSERLDRVFDVGFSKQGSRMRMHAGLANCYAIVEKHQGEITVDSEVGKGTTFRTTLPLRLS